MRSVVLAVLLSWCTLAGTLRAQTADKTTESYSRKNTFTLFAEYSNDSSPIVVGTARQRKLAVAGGAYTRRVVRFLGSDLSYQVELRPVVFESDPLAIQNTVATVTTGPTTGTTMTYTSSDVPLKCVPYTVTGTVQPSPPYFLGESYISTQTCGRQWTFGQSFAPIGFKYAVRTNHPVQPFLIGTLGYMYTSRPVPTAGAEAFNFVINIGAGLEVYRSKKRSVSVEARVQHFSNRDTAAENPGTDNLIFKVSYGFGR